MIAISARGFRGVRGWPAWWVALAGGVALAGCDQFASVGVVGLEPSGQGDAAAGIHLDDCGPSNPAGLSLEAVRALFAGGSEGLRWLYPYQGTVFPAQLPAPLLMWQGPASAAALLRVRSWPFEYTGCLPVEASGQILIPGAVWSALQASLEGFGGSVELQLTTLGPDGAVGPLSRVVELEPTAE